MPDGMKLERTHTHNWNRASKKWNGACKEWNEVEFPGREREEQRREGERRRETERREGGSEGGSGGRPPSPRMGQSMRPWGLQRVHRVEPLSSKFVAF